MYLQKKIRNLEREAQFNKIEINKSAAVATKAQKELDVARYKAGKLSRVVTELQRRLEGLENLRSRSNGSDQSPTLESGSDDTWGPRPGPGRPCGRIEAPQRDQVPSTGGSACWSDRMPPRRAGDEERDKWLSADSADAVVPSAPPFPRSAGSMPWSQCQRLLADTERFKMRSLRRT